MKLIELTQYLPLSELFKTDHFYDGAQFDLCAIPLLQSGPRYLHGLLNVIKIFA